jgi:hypothetical protein
MEKSMKAVFSPQNYTPSLIVQKTSFDEQWRTNPSWVLANMSHIAYFNETKIREFADQLGAANTRIYDRKGAQAFLAIWETRAILTFRGSQPKEEDAISKRKRGILNSIRSIFSRNPKLDPQTLRFLSNDAVADIKLIKVAFGDSDDVEVHAGFIEEVDKLWDEIRLDIARYAANIPIWVTGHSLGAAMATVAGMMHPFEDVTTFGEPRVGLNIDRAFKAKSHTRYVNGADPVTMVPPEWRPFDYKHHGSLKQIRDSDRRTDPRYDHSIIYYSENIARAS